MNWTDLFYFLPLAVLCNTVLPLPFDPVLIFFASRQSSDGAFLLAGIGSICAAAAAGMDVALLGFVRSKTSNRWMEWMPQWSGSRLYLLAFVFALLPLPFSIVRLAVLRNPPRMIPYATMVALGRFPRYLLTVFLWPVLGLPSLAPRILFYACVIFAAVRLAKKPLNLRVLEKTDS